MTYAGLELMAVLPSAKITSVHHYTWLFHARNPVLHLQGAGYGVAEGVGHVCTHLSRLMNPDSSQAGSVIRKRLVNWTSVPISKAFQWMLLGEGQSWAAAWGLGSSGL